MLRKNISLIKNLKFCEKEKCQVIIVLSVKDVRNLLR